MICYWCLLITLNFLLFLLDFFRGAVVSNVNLEGLDHVIVCTLVDGGKVSEAAFARVHVSM